MVGLTSCRRIQQKHQQAAVPCSKLLTLPFEIRLMIYDYVFTARDATYSDIRLVSSQNTESIAIGKRHEDVDILYQEAQLGVMALMLTCRAL